MDDGRGIVHADHLLRNLRRARWVIVVAVLLGLAMPNLLANREIYQPLWPTLVVYVGVVAVVIADGVLVTLDRFWGAARWPVAGVALGLSALGTAVLPPTAMVGPGHQTLGLVGWLGVLLLADTSLRGLAGFLGAHMGLTTLQLAVAGRADAEGLTVLATIAIGTIGFQLAVGLAGLALRRTAETSTATVARQAELLTAETVAQRIEADHNARYEQLRRTVVPLLRALAGGEADPSAPRVQRRAALEAARLRRLFGDVNDGGDQLAADLLDLVEVAERTGVVVTYATHGRWPSVPPGVGQVLLDEVATVLLRAESAARVTLSGSDEDVTVSVVVDGTGSAGTRRRDGVLVCTVTEQGKTWAEARWVR